MRTLIIAAHPDDEVLGCGGIISKCSDDVGVYVCIVTEPNEKWTKEYKEDKIIQQRKVDELLNIKKRYNLDLMTTELNIYASGIISKGIQEVVEEVRPHIVYTHFWGDVHSDHRVVFESTLVACKPPCRATIYCYEVLSETEWGREPFKPNTWRELAFEDVEKKINAFDVYKHEIKKYPHPRNGIGIMNLAEKRGSEVCIKWAETFHLIRMVGG